MCADANQFTFRNQAWAAIILIILLQSYWFVGTSALKDIEAYETEHNQLEEEIGRLLKAGNLTRENADKEPLVTPLIQRQENILPRLGGAQSAVETWNRVWDWAIFWAPDRSTDDQVTRERAEQRSAASMTSILGLYVLPLLYGWLGAILRSMRQIIDDDAPTAKSVLKMRLKIGLGAVAGPIVGLFLSPSVLSSIPAQTAPFALAFIAGYATDIFFAVLDRAVDSLHDLAKGTDKKADIPAADGGATGGNRAKPADRPQATPGEAPKAPDQPTQMPSPPQPTPGP